MNLPYYYCMNEMIRLIKESKHAIAFTGAGVSTFSGLKDFRGENGLGKTMEPEKIFDIGVFKRDPSYFYKHVRELVFDMENIEPSVVHKELARLESLGYVKAVITQNIDMLHQKGGSKNVIELHGTAEIGHCINCRKEYTYEEISPIASRGEVPYCSECNSPVKPDITFYGEPLSRKSFLKAFDESSKADLIIALGSTLVVQPAASFVETTLGMGGRMIMVNNQPTPYDHFADFHFDDLEEFCSLLKELK